MRKFSPLPPFPSCLLDLCTSNEFSCETLTVVKKMCSPYRFILLRLSITCRFLKLNRQMRFSLPSIKCLAAPPGFRLLPSTVSLTELCSTIWLQPARQYSESNSNQTHFQMISSAQWLVLKQRHKVHRKRPIRKDLSTQIPTCWWC